MRDYVIINGVSSLTIPGLAISKLPPISKPLMRSKKEEIDGRDGDIITKLGYAAYDKEMEIGLYNGFDINQVIAFFNSEGTITFSNESDKYYYFTILDQIDYEKLLKFKTATVTFHCQPFKYPTSETQISVDATTVSGEGESISLQSTTDMIPIISTLKGDSFQNGTPTPTTPLPVENVTGNQIISVCKKNIYNGLTTNKGANSAGVIAVQNTHYLGLEDKVPVAPNTTYTITFYGYELATTTIAEYKKDGSFIVRRSLSLSRTFTTGADTYFVFLWMFNNSFDYTTGTNAQIELGEDSTTFEEFSGNVYEINLGKNLFNKDSYNYLDGYYIDSTGKLVAGPYNRFVWLKLEPNTTYTLQQPKKSNVTTRIGLFSVVPVANSTSTLLGTITTTNPINLTFTTTTNGVYLGWVVYVTNAMGDYTTTEILECVQVEKGNPSSYAPYFEPIELCKIGDYQDKIYKENEKWYLHKEIGKVVLDGSESDSSYMKATTQNGNIAYGYKNVTDITTSLNSATGLVLSDKFTPTSWTNLYSNDVIGISNNTNISNGAIRLAFGNSSTLTTVSLLKTWLQSNNVTIYYVLNSPTTTEITNESLIAQLESLSGATTYDEITNISVNGILPTILSVSATGIPKTLVSNIGNIYAKPLLTIFGTGNVGVYLNGIQVLQIDMGDNTEITIDVSKMEAYDSETNVLLNRLVTGDYMNFLINSGNNYIILTGNVTNFTMNNYTRWL